MTCAIGAGCAVIGMVSCRSAGGASGSRVDRVSCGACSLWVYRPCPVLERVIMHCVIILKVSVRPCRLGYERLTGAHDIAVGVVLV